MLLLTGWSFVGGLLGLAAFGAVVGTVVRGGGREGVPAPLGLANRLTLLRLAAFSVLAGLAASAWFVPDAGVALTGWLPCVLYGAAALLDGVDGAVARRTGRESTFGARLDAEADALGLAAAGVTAVFVRGSLPGWYLVAGFARYLFGAGLWLERRAGRRVRELPPSPFRRRLAGFQMGLVAGSLVPWIEPAAGPPYAAALGLPFLLGFAWDYLVVSGRVDPAGRNAAGLLAFLRRAQPRVAAVAVLFAVVCAVAALAGAPTESVVLPALLFAWLLHPFRNPRT